MRVRSATALDAEERWLPPPRLHHGSLRYGPWRRPVSDRSLDGKQDLRIVNQVAGDTNVEDRDVLAGVCLLSAAVKSC